MANALGRISGQLLKDNLTRNGHDLEFDQYGLVEPILKLDVTNRYIGVNTDSSARALQVPGLIRTTNLISTGLDTPQIDINNNEIISATDINFSAATQVYADTISTDNIKIYNNVISTTTLNTNLELSPNGIGTVEVYNDFNITGNLRAHDIGPGSGNITLDGNVTFGSNDLDTVSFAADVNSDISPDLDNTYSLGSSSKKWEGVYPFLINGQAVTAAALSGGGMNLALRPGNIWFVGTTGDNANQGDHENGAFATLKYALTQAASGDEIFIYPGTYTEIFPLTVPQGVTVKGYGIRTVTIVPTVGTNTESAFLLNGETTVSDLTIKDFYAPGYAFEFATGFETTSRSPYIQNVSVITKGSVTTTTDPRGFDQGDAGGGAYVDGSLALSSSTSATMLFSGVTFITPGVDALVMTNGVRVEWLNSFTYFANRGLYATNGFLGFASLAEYQLTVEGVSTQTINPGDTITVPLIPSGTRTLTVDSVGYSGSTANIAVTGDITNIQSYTTSPPGSSVTYYTNKQVFGDPSYYARITRLGGKYTDGTHFNDAIFDDLIVVGSRVIVKWNNQPAEIDMGIVTLVDKGGYSFSNHYVYVTNPSNFGMPVLNGSPLVDYQASYFRIENNTVTLSGGQTGSYISSVTKLNGKLGAELRSIGSANIYGNYGAVADGDETLMYLISHNFAYIGTGAEDRNDVESVVQANEVVESNDGQIYYESVDQVGNFRIGDIFYVNQETGVVSFDAQAINFTSSGSIILEGPTSTTIIDATKVQTGNIKIYDNNIDSLSGPVNVLAHSGTTTLNTDVTVSGNLDITGSVYVDGNLFLGDNPLDTVTVFPKLTQNINPGITNNYSLGNNTGPKIWNTLFLSTALNVDNVISISNNTITTLSGGSDLRLVAAGSGIVNVTTTDVEITNNLTVNGTLTNSQFADVGITGLLDITGDWNPIGTVDRTGNTDITGTLTVNGVHTVDMYDVQVSGNTITTTAPDTDLELSALTLTKLVKTMSSNVEITNNLDVLTDSYFDVINITTSVEAINFTFGDIDITANTITTHAPNIDLELVADGNGIINVTTTDVEITNNLTVNGTATDSEFADVDITGLLDITGDWDPTGDVDRTGDTDITGTLTVNGVHTADIYDVQVSGNTITTTATNSDLELSALTTTKLVKTQSSDVEITNDLEVILDSEFGVTNVTTTVEATTFTVGDIDITANSITTHAPNINLVLSADGDGLVKVLTTNVEITNDLTVNGTVADSQFADVGITGLLDITGDWDPTGAVDRTGDTDITGSLTVNGANTVQFEDIQVIGNNITTTLGTDLELSAITPTKLVKTLTSDVEITNDLDVTLDGEFGSANVTLGVTLNDLDTTGFTTLTTTQTAQNVSGTSTPTGFFFYGWADDPGQSNPPFGVIQVGWTCVQIPGSVVTVVGDGVTNYDITITGGSFVSGVSYSFAGDVVTSGIHIVDNTISTTSNNTDLELKAFAGQTIHFVTSDVNIANDLTIAGPATFNGDSTLLSVEIDGDTTIVGDLNQTVGDTYITGNFNNNNILIESPSYFEVPNIKIDDNIISVTALDTNLEFRANGTGGVTFDQQIKINTNVISNIFDVNNIDLSFNNLYLAEDGQLLLTEDGDTYLLDVKNDRDLSIILQPNGTGNVIIDSTNALVLAYGNASNKTLEYLGEIRQNSTNKRYEGFSPDGIVSFNNIYDTDGNTYITPELTPGANDNTLRFAINNIINTTVTATEMFSSQLTVNNVSISSNTITNLNGTADLTFAPNGTGNVLLNNIGFNANNIINTENTALIINSTGTGYVKFTGTAGLVLPIGDNSNRNATPEIAETRYNTDIGGVEIFTNSGWNSLRGSASTATEEEIIAETDLWAFVLG